MAEFKGCTYAGAEGRAGTGKTGGPPPGAATAVGSVGKGNAASGSTGRGAKAGPYQLNDSCAGEGRRHT